MTGNLVIALDLVLAVMLLGLVAATLWTRDHARMVMLFIAFGGLLALTWIRLRAPDVALAEAAIGSALTGGLLLRARWVMPGPQPLAPARRAVRVAAAAASVGAFVALAWTMLTLEWPRSSPTAVEVSAYLGASGVSNPVTAVLLNFRAYDTLLEVAVLLIAAIVIWMLRPQASVTAPLKNDPLFLAMLRILVPSLCLIAGYLLWLGAFAPGGAFQAAAVLSAALLLLLLAGVANAPGASDRPWLRWVLVAGLLTFVAVAVAMSLAGGALLQFPKAQAKHYILLIEAVLTFSIAFTLLTLFVGGRPAKIEETP